MKNELSNPPESEGSQAKGANVSLTCSLTQVGSLNLPLYGRQRCQVGRGGQQDMSSTMSVRNKLVQGTPTSLKTSVRSLFCRADMIVLAATFELKSPNAMRRIGFQGAEAKCWHIIAKGKVVVITLMDRGVKAVAIIV